MINLFLVTNDMSLKGLLGTTDPFVVTNDDKYDMNG